MKPESSLIITKADNGYRLDLETYGGCYVGTEEKPTPRTFHLVYPDTAMGVVEMLDSIRDEIGRED